MRLDESPRMARRCFLTSTVSVGAGVFGTLALLPGRSAEIPPAELRNTIGRVIQAYDAQGFHRTGTDVDRESARWLAAEVWNHSMSTASIPAPPSFNWGTIASTGCRSLTGPSPP